MQLLVILALTFWFGVFALAGMLFVYPRAENSARRHATDLRLDGRRQHPCECDRLVPLSLCRLAAVRRSCCWRWPPPTWRRAALHRGEIKIFRWKCPCRRCKLTLYQIAIASADMLVAGCVLYVIFPPIRGGYLTVLAVYLVAYVMVVLSHVPGGWGVLEAMIILLLTNLQLVCDRPGTEGGRRALDLPRDLLSRAAAVRLAAGRRA